MTMWSTRPGMIATGQGRSVGSIWVQKFGQARNISDRPQLDLVRDIECVVHLDAEVADGTLEPSQRHRRARSPRRSQRRPISDRWPGRAWGDATGNQAFGSVSASPKLRNQHSLTDNRTQGIGGRDFHVND